MNLNLYVIFLLKTLIKRKTKLFLNMPASPTVRIANMNIETKSKSFSDKKLKLNLYARI